MSETRIDAPSEFKEQPHERVFFVYRDNDLFQKHIPEMTQALTASGFEIVEQRFPEGTEEKDIAEWVLAHLSDLQEVELFTDETFERSVMNALRDIDDKTLRETAKTLISSSNGLDQIMDEAAFAAILGPEWKETQGPWYSRGKEALESFDMGLEQAERVFVAVVKRILGNPDNRPDNVYIVPDKLNEHGPFHKITPVEYEKLVDGYVTKVQEEFPDFSGEMIEPFREGDEARKQREARLKEFSENNPTFKLSFSVYRYKRIAEETAAGVVIPKLLAAWLSESGIDSSKVQTLSETENWQMQRDESEGVNLSDKTWFLRDRHNSQFYTRKGYNFPLPLLNFINAAVSNKLIEVNSEELDKAIVDSTVLLAKKQRDQKHNKKE